MDDKFIWDLPSTTSLNNTDKIFSVKGTSEYLITVSDLLNSLSLPSQSDYEKLAKLNINGNGNSFFANDGNYKLLTDLFDTTQFEKNETSARIELIGWHEHTNQTTVLDKFSLNIDGDLLFDGEEINYTLPTASTTELGGVKVDGTTVTITDGVISSASAYTLPTASDAVLGGVKIDNNTIIIDENGVISAVNNGTLNLDNLIQDNGITITKDVGNNTATFKLNIPNWTAETNYYVGNYVLNENKIYKCKTLHTSGLTFDEINWDMIGGSDGTKIADWISGTEYFLKDLVIYSNSIWQCTTANSDAIWTESNWNCVSTGADGINAYVYIKYSAIQPTQDSDITDTPSNWIGFYSGSSETAPTTYTSYQWYNYKGATGETGSDGTTPHIDETTKNWFIGTTNTGIKAQGVDGITTVQSTAIEYTGTLLSTGWTSTAPYTQIVSITGLTKSMPKPILDVILSSSLSLKIDENNQWSYIVEAETGTDILTVTCLERKPTINLNFMLKVTHCFK